VSDLTHPKRKRRPKFNNIRTTIDGVTFASKKEAARWVFLKGLEANGVICDLQRQVRYPLHVNGKRIGTYIPDFEYTIVATKQPITEDVKGKLTPLYRRSAKHLLAEYNIAVVEVFKPEEPVS